MTKKQAQWAEGHDWFHSSVHLGGGSYIVYVYDNMVNSIVGKLSYKSLREWAGY